MNPPKTKTLRRAFRAIPGTVKRELVKLVADNRYAYAAFGWLESHADGWRTSVELLADALSCSLSSAYAALRLLRARGWLDVDADVWTLQLVGCTAAHSHARALIREKNQPTKEKLIVRANSQTTTISTQSSKQGRQMSRPTKTPDNHGREVVDDALKLKSLPAFVEYWGATFPRNGPASTTVLSSSWQSRLMFVREYWSRDEIATAFKRTRDRQETSAIWSYFCACLDAIAAGTYVDDVELERRSERKRRPQNLYDARDYEFSNEAPAIAYIDHDAPKMTSDEIDAAEALEEAQILAELAAEKAAREGGGDV